MTTGQSVLFIVCAGIVVVSGLSMALLGAGSSVLSWLLVAIGLVNVGIGLGSYVLAKRRFLP